MSAFPPDAAAQRAQAAGEVGESATTTEPDGGGEASEASGVPAADEAAARLRDLDEAPVDEHVAIYEDAHRRLEEGLADLDER